MAFSRDETWLASSSTDASVYLWNFQTGLPENANVKLKSSLGPVNALQFPERERLFGGAENHTLLAWDLSAGIPSEEKFVLDGHEGKISTMLFDPGLGVVAIPDNNDFSLELWNDESEHVDLRGHKNIIRSMAFSPDGLWLVSGDADSTINVWNIEEGGVKVISPTLLQGHTDDVHAVTFSPDGSWLASVVPTPQYVSGTFERAYLRMHPFFYGSIRARSILFHSARAGDG